MDQKRSRLFYPLDEFYDYLGLSLPTVMQVDGQDVPEPYRSLLVHENDMTPTLESAYTSRVHLRVLNYTVTDDVFSRQIVLFLEGSEKKVEFGAIKIYLKYFPPQARRLLLERKQPLGTILKGESVAHVSRPVAYLRVTSDTVINSALNLPGTYSLYGRRNAMFDPSGNTLAQIIEILPPSNHVALSGRPGPSRTRT